MEILLLAITCAVLSIMVVLLGSCLPFLLYKIFRLEKKSEETDTKISTLDEALVTLLDIVHGKKG